VARAFVLLVALAWVMIVIDGSGAARADSVGSLGEADRLVIRGTTQIDGEQLRQPLVRDTDVIWLARPHGSRDTFIAAVVRKATRALERAGFAQAEVRAAVESSDGVERLVLDVVEGPRCEAGAIEVTGLPDDMRARLVRFLSEGQPPRDAVPRSVRQSDGAETTLWVADDGRIVPLDQPAWKSTGSAACDSATMYHIQSEVARFLREEGYVSVPPPPHDRRSGRLTRNAGGLNQPASTDGGRARRGAFDVTFKPDGSTVDLVVAIHDLPPKTVLSRIELPPECRTTERDLSAYLGLKLGEPVNDRDRLAWRDRLRRSGRFLKSDVEFRIDPTDPAAAVARFSLEEYPAATPLSQPLSREEATMLRVHDWLVEAIGRGNDLVVDGVRSTGDAATGTAVAAQLVISPTMGFLFTALPAGDRPCGLALTPTACSLLPVGGGGRLDLPLPSAYRLTATVGLSLERGKPTGQTTGQTPSTFRRHLSFGCGLANATADEPAGVRLALAIEPVACLALVHEDSPEVRFEGETLVIDAGGAISRFDATTGRPLGLAIAGWELTLLSRPESLAPAVEELREAAGPNMLRGDAPVASAVEFLLSDEVAAACGRVADAAGLRGGQWSVWEDRLTRVVDVVRRCRDDGGLERCDRMLATAAVEQEEGSTAAAEVRPLDIPLEEEPTSATTAHKALLRHMAAVVWRLTEEHCGRTSWPAALVRGGALALVGDPALLDEMTEFMAADEYGPLAYVSASALVNMPLVATSLARRGQERLSTVAFHTDCHPLLTACSPYGFDGWSVSILRSLDDAAAGEIGRIVCGDAEVLLPLVHAIKAHERHEDAVAGLQAALDSWWDDALRSVVAAKLNAVASPRTATAPEAHNEQPRR
jgi:hypothetical protein